MRFTVMASENSAHQKAHQLAMIEGLRANGIAAIASPNRAVANTDLIVCWGWRIAEPLVRAGKKVLIMERGYIGDRFKYSSLAWNGLNGYGRFAEIDDGGKRFSEVAELKPWKQDGDFVLVMGQVPGDQSLKGKSLIPWYEKVINEASTHYDMPVFFRAHPLAYKRGTFPPPRGAGVVNCSLELALEKAAVVVTFNSNSGVDAAISGTPVVAYDEGSMAWPVSTHNVLEISRPCRENWAYKLAWKQWTIEEIKSGLALSYLIKEVPNG